MKITFRNKQALFFLFAFPLLFMGLFGIIFGNGQGSATIAVVKQDDSAVVNRLSEAFEDLDKSEAFKIKNYQKKQRLPTLKPRM